MTLLRKLFFVSCSVSFLASAAQSQSSPKICAEAVVVIGKVTEEPSGKMVRVGEKLAEGVKLKTNSDAFVKLLLKDNSVIDISPQTQFFLKQCAAPELIGIDLELELGRVRANVNSEPAQPRKKFQMKTPTSVLAVRGTEFFVSWGKDSTGFVNERVSVSEGQVEIRSLFQQNAPPTLLQTGTEFRAEGILQNGNRQPPRIDQFNAPEQRQLEQEQKIQETIFLNAVDRKNETKTKKVSTLGKMNQELSEFISRPQRNLNSDNEKKRGSSRRNDGDSFFGGGLGQGLGGTTSGQQTPNAQISFTTGTAFLGVTLDD